ncbi:MAG: family 10 glycosylhydrolase [Clostridiales bacterium]|nr:family 10 glycosylhydrolase [Clostridiales bacterium]
MKKITAIILIFVICILCACARNSGSPEETTGNTQSSQNNTEEFRGVWFSFYDLDMSDKSEEYFDSEICKMFDNVKKIGLNNVFVHVRPFADAFYKSAYFPWSSILTGTQGKDPGFDPLSVMVTRAHERGLKIHAWINPFRVSKSDDFEKLSDDNIAKKWKNGSEEEQEKVFVCDGRIYFNPTLSDVHRLIYDGIREIINNYRVDGLHIDDYFYPSTEEYIDSAQYCRYIDSGGTLSLEDWRRANISAFVSGMYDTVKACDKNVIVSISPSSNIEKDYSEMYADVQKWSCEEGYTDIIIPQIYFGFEHDKLPFSTVAEQWDKMHENSAVQLVCGLAFYKTNTVDKYARSGQNEWIENDDIISRQITDIRNRHNYSGFCLYSYNSLFVEETDGNYNNELKNLLSVL